MTECACCGIKILVYSARKIRIKRKRCLCNPCTERIKAAKGIAEHTGKTPNISIGGISISWLERFFEDV